MTIIKRADLGRPLTWDELDNNFAQVDSLVTTASTAVETATTQAQAASAFANAASQSSQDAQTAAASAGSAAEAAVAGIYSDFASSDVGKGASLVGPGLISRNNDRFSILQGRTGEQFAADITRGLGIQLADTISGSGLTVNTAKFNYIRIDDDRFNAVDDLVPGTKVDGLLINHKFGGAGTKGGRHAAEFILEQTGLTEASNTDRNYVGCVGFATSSVGDGGADFASAKGAYFGGNFYGTLTPGAMYALNVTGAEFNVGIPEGASANIRTGLQIGGTKTKRGDVIDAAISVGNIGGAVTWRTGIAFGPQNGGAVFGEDSRVISVDCDTIDRVLSLSSLTNVNHIIFHNLVKLSTKSLLMEDTGAFVSLGSPTVAGTSVLQARTSGLSSAYDSRILFSGGSATSGTGTISFNAALISVNSLVRPSSDNAINLGSSALRFSSSFIAKRYWTATVYDSSGTGSPEGLLSASVGSTYRRTDGGTSTTFYVKESGTGNTGWVAK